jgi:hypothetical protein
MARNPPRTREDYSDNNIVELPASFYVWAASPEAKFLNGKFVWVNWDVDELKERAVEIESSGLLTLTLDGLKYISK